MGQLLFNALVNGAILAPPAIAFTMLFAILRFPNFAVGAFITVGAFSAYAFNVNLGWPLVPAALAAMVVTAVLFWLSDVIVFQPLRAHPEITLLIVSIALAFIVESIVRLFFGSGVRGLDLPLLRPMMVGGVRVNLDQLYIVITAFGAMAATHLLLRYTALGKAMRAAADNLALAEVRGIDTARVIAATWLFGGALIAISGVTAGVDLVIEPLLGWHLIIPVFAAAILGGIGSPYGAMAGAMAVGLAEELTVLVMPSAYKVAVAFVIIAIMLLIRPHGLFGQPEIKK